MALAPKQILQHMEIPSSEEGYPWPGGAGVFILGSLEPVRVSLIAQQVRAINLIYALACEDRLARGTKVGILGAGPAGLTAACAAAHLGAEVTVFEREDRPFAVFCPNCGGNRRRYVHPNMDTWPERGWSDKRAHLEFLPWEAGPPIDIVNGFVEKLRDEFGSGNNSSAGSVDIILRSHAHIEIGNLKPWAITYRGEVWDWTWDARKPSYSGPTKYDREDLDVLIFAIGFGIDDPHQDGNANGQSGYWCDDSKQWTDLKALSPDRKVIISGSGDGALIDALCVCLLRNAQRRGVDIEIDELHRSAINALQSWEIDHALLKALLKIETDISRRRLSPQGLWHEYKKLKQIKDVDQQFRKVEKILDLEEGRPLNVILATDETAPLRPTTFAINRFIVWRLLDRQLLDHQTGRLQSEGKPFVIGPTDETRVLSLVGHNPSGIGGQREIRIVGALIKRHGPKRAMEVQYESLAKICKRIIAPRNELDQTRVPCWPSNFFASPELTTSPVDDTVPDVDRLPAGALEPVLNRRGSHSVNVQKRNPIVIDAIHVAVVTSRADETSRKWTKTDCLVRFRFDESSNNSASPLLLEHHLTFSYPMRLRILKQSEGIIPQRLKEAPPWSVAYLVETNRGPQHVRFEGNPCGLLAITDSFGFPIYGDMMVKRLTLAVYFLNLTPWVLERNRRQEGYVRSLSEPIRRLNYEAESDGDPFLGLSQPGEPIFLHPCGPKTDTTTGKPIKPSSWRRRLIWNGGDEGLPLGYFFGVTWTGLKEEPNKAAADSSIHSQDSRGNA
jgi:hypothetical protein